MIKIQRPGLKVYFFIFFLLALGKALSLFSPQAPIYIYYHIMQAFHPASRIHYEFALFSAGLTLLCLIPVFFQAFLFPKMSLPLFKALFIMRLLADLFGHNYERQFFSGSLISEPLVGWAHLALFLLILFPSYQAHYLYAFKKAQDTRISQ